MIRPRVYVACIWGALAVVSLCYGVLRGSAEAYRLFLLFLLPLIVFIWWLVDRAALERRVSRLEARSEIADERRVTSQTGITEVGNRLREIERRVVDVENLGSPADEAQDKTDFHETAHGSESVQPERVHKTIMVSPPVNLQ